MASAKGEHPRLRGEGKNRPVASQRAAGTPPPTRGRAPRVSKRQGYKGNTPAYAGKGARTSIGTRPSWEHPRLRGEGWNARLALLTLLGTPPPTRGRDPPADAPPAIPGNTPAYAGKGCGAASLCVHPREHPRLRGEGLQELMPPIGEMGTPPPTRGREVLIGYFTVNYGNTPAYAGKGGSRLPAVR